MNKLMNKLMNKSLQVLQTAVKLRGNYTCPQCRGFVTSLARASGHSRWSTIKHDKGKNDAVKARQRTLLAQEMLQASKLFGADPSVNPRLANAITAAKKAGFPKASIESSIARGQGLSPSGATLESLTIEAMLPPAIALVIDCQTENKARALPELRKLIKDHGGSTTPTAYMFERRGRVLFEQDDRQLGPDDILEDAIEAGAEDVDVDDAGNLVVYTDPSKTISTATALESKLRLKVQSSDIIWDPNKDTLVTLDDGETKMALDKFVEELRDDPRVQDIYVNVL